MPEAIKYIMGHLLQDILDSDIRKLAQKVNSETISEDKRDRNLSNQNKWTNRPSFKIDLTENHIESKENLKSHTSRKFTEPISWQRRESKDKGWALKCFCTNNILLAKNQNKKVSHTSINGSHKLFIQSPDGRLPYGSALKIILWLSDQAFKTKSRNLTQSNLKQVLEQIGISVHNENRKMFLQVLSILRKTTFCYTEGKKVTTGNFRIIDSYSYKDDPKLGNRLVIKLTTEFIQLFENKKFVRAFDYEVIRKLGCDYTSLHFYLFSLQRTFKKGPEAHIRIQEFLLECGSTFRDCVAFFRKIKDVVIPKLIRVLEEVYGDSFEGIFEAITSSKNKLRRIVIKMGKLLLPSKAEPLKAFLKRCCQLLMNHGLLAKEKLTQEERDRLHIETGQYLEELVKLPSQKLQKMLILGQ